MRYLLRALMVFLIWAAIVAVMALEPIQTPMGYSHPPECLCVDCERSWDVQWLKDHPEAN